MSRQALSGLWTWVKKQLILDPEGMETKGQGWISYSSCTDRDAWTEISFYLPLIS